MIRPVRRYAYWFLGVAVAVAWLTPATEAKEPNPIVQLAKKLAEPVDFPGLDDPKTTLGDALELLTQKYDLRFDVNEKAFQPGGLAGATARAPRLGGHDILLVVADDKAALGNKPDPAKKDTPPAKPPAARAARASSGAG